MDIIWPALLGLTATVIFVLLAGTYYLYGKTFEEWRKMLYATADFVLLPAVWVVSSLRWPHAFGWLMPLAAVLWIVGVVCVVVVYITENWDSTILKFGFFIGLVLGPQILLAIGSLAMMIYVGYAYLVH